MAHVISQSLQRKIELMHDSQYDTLGSFCLLDTAGRYLAYNRTTLDWIGMSRTHDLLGKTIDQTPWAHHKKQLYHHNKQVYRSNTPMSFYEYVFSDESNPICTTTIKQPFHHQDKLVGIEVRAIRIPCDQLASLRPYTDETVFIDTRSNRVLQISNRRRESLYMLLHGLNFREIGERRGLSSRTVEHHIEHVRLKNGYRTIRDILLHVRAF